MKKLKIVFVLLNPIPSPDAAWTRIEFFAKYLKNLDANIGVEVMGAFSLKTLSQAGSHESDTISIQNFIPVIIMTNIFSQIFNIVSPFIVSFFLFLKLRPNLVVISVPSSGNVLGCYIMSKLFRSKIVTDYRDEWEDYTLHLVQGNVSKHLLRHIKKAMTICYRSSSAVMTVTESLANSLKKRGIDNVNFVPNGADLTQFKPKSKIACRKKVGIQERLFVIVYSGYIGAYYRIDLLIYALKKLAESKGGSDTSLIIAGHGQGLQSVLKIIDEVGLSDRVSYLGKKTSKEQLAEILCTADVGVIPYDSNPLWRNSLPVKSLEYLACGLPIIATAYEDSIIGKLIVENELGVLAKPEDIDSLSEALKIMKDDEKFRTNASRNALSLICQDFDRHKIAIDFHKMLLRCLDNEYQK